MVAEYCHLARTSRHGQRLCLAVKQHFVEFGDYYMHGSQGYTLTHGSQGLTLRIKFDRVYAAFHIECGFGFVVVFAIEDLAERADSVGQRNIDTLDT